MADVQDQPLYKRFDQEQPPFGERLLVTWEERTKEVWMATRFKAQNAQDTTSTTTPTDTQAYWITTAGISIAEINKKPVLWAQVPKPDVKQ